MPKLGINTEIALKNDIFVGAEEQDFSLRWLGRSNSFINEEKNNILFAFTVKNTTGNTKKLCLNPAYYDIGRLDITQDGATKDITAAVIKYDDITGINAAGHSVDAMLCAGDVIVDDATHKLTIIEKRGRIREFLEFVKHNPARVVKTTISANDKVVFEEDIVINDVNPFQKTPDEVISISESYRTSQSLENKVVVEDNYQIDVNKVVSMAIPGLANGTNNVELTVTFTIGAVESAAYGLEQKAEEATESIAAAVMGR